MLLMVLFAWRIGWQFFLPYFLSLMLQLLVDFGRIGNWMRLQFTLVMKKGSARAFHPERRLTTDSFADRERFNRTGGSEAHRRILLKEKRRLTVSLSLIRRH